MEHRTNTSLMQPISPEHCLDAHSLRLENEGYTIVPDAIPADYLAQLSPRFDEMIADYEKIPTSLLHPQTNAIDINRIMDVDPLFDDLLDLPSVFSIVESAYEGQIQLLGAPMGNYTPAGATPRGAWHMDGAGYMRFTYFLDDITEAEGPTAVLPGSHRQAAQPPEWFNDEQQMPREFPGMVRVTGKAGTCLVNNTHIWHTGTPNTSKRPRRIIWVVFKHATWPDIPPEHLRVTEEFAARQTLPIRRRLCGLPD